MVDVDSFALHNAFELNYPQAMDGVTTALELESGIGDVKVIARDGLGVVQVARRDGDGVEAGLIDRYGNTSAASVPICLHELVAAGRVKTGDHVLFVALGGGLTWASSVWKLCTG